MNILLDTNILVFISRSKNFNSLVNFINPENSLIYISIVTQGEIQSLAVRKKWNEKRIELIENFIERIGIIDVNQRLIRAYSDIDSYSQRENPSFETYPFSTPRNMGKNDLWIASVAAMMGLELVTTDNDFDHLNDVFFDIRKIQPVDFLPFF